MFSVLSEGSTVSFFSHRHDSQDLSIRSLQAVARGLSDDWLKPHVTIRDQKTDAVVHHNKDAKWIVMDDRDDETGR